MSFAAVSPPRERKIDLPLVGLAVALIAGVGLRLYGLDWDGGNLFHPDERHILMVTASIGLPWPPDLQQLLTPESPLNPKSFAYGSFIFYLLKFTSFVVSSLGNLIGFLSPLKATGDFDQLRIVGRLLSTCFDLGTVVAVYLLGRRVYSAAVGTLAAILVAFSVINIQLAHFYASDTLLTLLVVVVVLLSVRMVNECSIRDSLLVGLALGLALATKISGLPVVLALVTAHGLRLLTSSDGGQDSGFVLRAPGLVDIQRTVVSLLATGAATGAAFLIAEPYALIDSATFLRHLSEQNQMVRGIADLPYTRQYIGRPPYVYEIANLALWGVGLPLGAAMVVGTLAAVFRSLVKAHRAELVLLAWVVPYFLVTGSFHAKFLRYLLPIVPFMCLFAASALVSVLTWRRRQRARGEIDHRFVARLWAGLPWPPAIGVVVVGLVVLGTVFYALAFANIYSVAHPAVRASEWMYQNIPDGSRIAREHWEEGLPVVVRGAEGQDDPQGHGYSIGTLNMYDDDNASKLDHLVQELSDSDYIVFYSQRLYGTIPRLPERYPLSSQYYRLLFSGQLGYGLDAFFTSYPSLLGVAFVDDTLNDPGLVAPRALASYRPGQVNLDLGRADESFTVYDHPKVLIFKNQRHLSSGELRGLLAPALGTEQTTPQVAATGPAQSKVALFSPERWQEMEAGGTFSELFDVSAWENQQPVVAWVVLIGLLGVAVLPSTLWLFRRLPDRGYGLARSVGILALGWLTWMIVSVRLLPNTRMTVLLALLILIAINLAVFLRQRRAFIAALRENRRLIVVTELVFWGALALFLTIRLANPDLWHPARGGEKPMDLAYLMAVVKSQWFPPYDPWFAGGYLNYYYFGQIIVATLIKLSGVVPTTAYNLVVPLLFALAFSGTFSIVFNLAALKDGGGRLQGRWLAVGAGGGFIALMLGNLGGALQLGKSLIELSPVKFSGSFIGLDVVIGLAGGLWQAISHTASLNIPTDWYWASTRVIEGTINEFPFFSFLFADLHAHLIALPFTALALGVGLAWLTVGSDIAGGWRRRLQPDGGGCPTGTPSVSADGAVGYEGALASTSLLELASLVVVSALAVGALFPINSWDYPTYLIIVCLGVLVPWWSRGRLDLPGLLARVLIIAGIGILSYVLYWPFHSNFQMFYSGVELIGERSDLGGYLTIHGLLLFAVGSYIVVRIAERWPRGSALRLIKLGLKEWDRAARLDRLLRVRVPRAREEAVLVACACLAGLLATMLLAALGYSVAIVLAVVVGATAVLGTVLRRSPVDVFVLGLIALGACLGIACEFVAIKGDVGRMNTVFKFYLQVWMMWSMAGAFGLYTVVSSLRRWRPAWLSRGWLVALAVLLSATCVYPLVGTVARVSDRFDRSIPPTLDGTAYMTRAVYRDQDHDLVLSRDLAAIKWLQANIKGSPVILEGRSPFYRWGSRVSIYTGLPTILGWDWHQKQQRAGYATLVDQRAGDVSELYGTISLDRTRELLHKYGVRYIYVGDLERAYYPSEGLAKFDRMLGGELRLIYDRDGVKIYEVSTTG